MNKAIGVGIGIGVLVIAFVIVGGSTMGGDMPSLPFYDDDNNSMEIGDRVSVTVNPSTEEDLEINEEVEAESDSEGKALEVNLVDGVTATSKP